MAVKRALDAIVVVPARDEQERVGRCIEALARQTVARDRFETIVVLDGCRDATGTIARRTADALGLPMKLVTLDPGRGPGAARRRGMDEACARLLADGRPRGLIASTDADSRPARDWLERQLAHAHAGTDAVAGKIELDPDEASQLPAVVLRGRAQEAARRLRRVRETDPAAEHHHFGGASFAVTAEIYRRVGGIPPVGALEDAAFAQRLARHGVPIARAANVVVQTSARTRGRASRGLAHDLAQAIRRGVARCAP